MQSGVGGSGDVFLAGNMWFVKFSDFTLQPTAPTTHKFPI